MTNRKIENDRLVEMIEAFRGHGLEQEPLSDVGVIEQTAPPVAEALATAAPGIDRPASAPPTQSLRQALAEFVMPKVTHPGLLHGARTTLILEQLVSDVLPNLEGGEELRALASAVLEDEIGRHRELSGRIHAGLAA